MSVRISSKGLFTLVLCALFAACGGGGGGASDSTSTAIPIASAKVVGPGGGAIMQEAAFTLLDATASADPIGHTLTFAWSLDQRPVGSTRPLVPSEVPHIVQFDPDLPGDYTATLVVSNGTAQSAPLAIPFTVIPDPPWFNYPILVELYRPHYTPFTVYDRWAVTVRRAYSQYPFTIEVLFNGESQGIKTLADQELLLASIRGSGETYALFFPITGYPGGDYNVRVVVRAGGKSATFDQTFTFPACDPPETPQSSTLRSCPPS